MQLIQIALSKTIPIVWKFITAGNGTQTINDLWKCSEPNKNIIGTDMSIMGKNFQLCSKLPERKSASRTTKYKTGSTVCMYKYIYCQINFFNIK